MVTGTGLRMMPGCRYIPLRQALNLQNSRTEYRSRFAVIFLTFTSATPTPQRNKNPNPIYLSSTNKGANSVTGAVGVAIKGSVLGTSLDRVATD